MSEETSLANDRFGFTVFLSACIHAIVIIGLGFSYFEITNSEPALAITLAQYRSEIAPETADYLAQENQVGSGTLDTKATPSTPFRSEFHDTGIQEVIPVPQTVAANEQPIKPDLSVITTRNAFDQISQQLEENISDSHSPLTDKSRPEDISLAIASLQAQLDRQKQAYAKRPRKYTISSASTKRSYDALYLDSWRKRIEAVGNLNYPTLARQQQLYGNLRLLVALLPDGDVHTIRILQSSGYKILDDAAIRIVNLASPFSPFPMELRENVDILEIIRTWKFHKGNSFSSY